LKVDFNMQDLLKKFPSNNKICGLKMLATMNNFCQQLYDAPAGLVEFCEVGSGLPVLYFHGTGAGNDAAVLLEQELIASGCRLIVPNRPGYFRTALGPHGSVSYCARLAVELLDHLNLDRVAVLGTSGGGMPAAAFARLHPGRTAALVLQCAQAHRWDHGRWLPKGMGRSLFLFHHQACRPFLRWYNRFHAWSMARCPASCLRGMSGLRLPYLERDATVMQAIKQLTEMTAACAAQPRGVENDWAILVGDNGIRAGSISCPTLIIHDREDPLVPFAHAEWSHASIADSQLLDICAGGHLIWFGPDASTMNQRRMEFLKAHVAA
jgi:pimeloyl-ACP methyl ester carboxylesterase